MSDFGRWVAIDSLPAFEYTADDGRAGRDRWVSLGNRRLQLVADNHGGVGLWDEHDALRWLTAPDPIGTGISTVIVDGRQWGTTGDTWPADAAPVRTFGPTWFRIAVEHDGVTLERTILCPEGDAPWVLVRVRLTATAGESVRLRHREEWAVRPRFSNVFVPPDAARTFAAQHVSFEVEASGAAVVATEVRSAQPAPGTASGDGAADPPNPFATRERALVGTPVRMRLDALGGTPAVAATDGASHPTLTLETDLELAPGTAQDLWFRFGIDDGSEVRDPAGEFARSRAALRDRLPRAVSEQAPLAEREIPWRAALLSGGTCADGVIGGHTLDEGGLYNHVFGLNIAARDPLQHAIPLVYCEPDLALSVLRNTCGWAAPDGFMPWALDGAKGVASGLPGLPQHASDLHLWAFWLAAEYAIATGDIDAFATTVPFHPMHGADPEPLGENLRRQFRHFVDGVGLGEHGHVRLLDCDWSDAFLGPEAPGVTREMLADRGESIMNSAMAAWILPRFAYLCDRLGEDATAKEARELGAHLKELVAGEWTGSWFRRAYCGDVVYGDDRLFLEPQGWAILCGAADDDQAQGLLRTIDERLRTGSPLGAREQWPVPGEGEMTFAPGTGLAGGVWFALNSVLVWAASKHDKALGWDEWRRSTFAGHTEAYPSIWEGTLSGGDAYNAPESTRAGHAFGDARLGGPFPVDNMHSHSQPLLAYLRLLGVEPGADGSLRVGGGAAFASQTFEVRADGGGRLLAQGPVTVRSPAGDATGGPGELTW